MIRSAEARVNPAARPAPPGHQKIPYAFRADPVALDEFKLDPTARSAFVLILDNARSRGGRCRLSNATMGRILNRCPMTISRALGRLEAAGLIFRELAAGGRVRTGISITWEGVQRLTGQAPVRREDLTGSARASEGLGASADLIRSPTQSERPDRPDPLSMGEGSDPASRVATGPEAAAYLRACIEAGKRGQEPPPPPGGTYTVGPPSPKGVASGNTPAPDVREISPTSQASLVPQDDVSRAVGRMVRDLGQALKAESVGRRRVGPAKLARQLAELRRKHGRREVEMKEGGPDRLSRS